MAITKEIGKYSLARYVGAGVAGVINLHDTHNASIANLYFGLDNSTPPSSSQVGNQYHFYYRARDWPVIVDMLRNEKPLYLHWLTKSGYVGTSAEPVGEEENATP